MTFQCYQDAFAAYIRQPQDNPLPLGVKPERMAVYRELFFNNVTGFLSANFPVLHQIMGEAAWQQLAQDFFATHRCQTPYFSDISEEFLHYLQNERQCTADLPFMVELAHYEWVEMALAIAQGTLRLCPVDNLVDSSLALSNFACVLAYQFPVHRLSPQYIPLTVPVQPTFLVVYRDVNEDVQFLDITLLTYQLLQLIQETPRQRVQDYLTQLLALFPAVDEAALRRHGEAILSDFALRGVVVCAN